MSIRFKTLKISEWQQFQEIDIDFHEKLTILTGANGSGKTTILVDILAKHIDGWAVDSFSTPKKDEICGEKSSFTRSSGEVAALPTSNVFGEIIYTDNEKIDLCVPSQTSSQLKYTIQIEPKKPVRCFLIPSHRSVFHYQPIDSIPFQKRSKLDAFKAISWDIRANYLKGHNPKKSLLMKNILIGWAIQGYGVQDQDRYIMPKNEDQIKFYEGFQNVLKQILPKTLGFERFEIRREEIVFVCNQGKDEFIFEQASGGLSSLIDIVWQIYMYSTEECVDFTVIIDEVENHLHPTMQRQILPNLLKAFPGASFIVSTHSPLVVGSIRDSNVYVLKYDSNGKVISQKLDLINKAKTATEILDEVLGVSFTMPIWAEEALKEIVDDYSGKDVSLIDFAQMRNDLKIIGLESLMPEAIHSVVANKNDQN